MLKWLSAWGVCLLVLASAPSAIEAQACSAGQVLQGGHCCWPAQHYDASAGRCAGAPACPRDFVPDGDDACAPAPPAPTVCAAGRVSVGGYCCWPQQTFDLAANRCTGPPACPPGFVGVGAECERTTADSDRTTTVEPTASPRLPARATARARSPAAIRTPTPGRPARERDVPLLAGGAVLFFLPYVVTVFAHYGLGTSVNSSWSAGARAVAPLWPLTLFPVTHNFALLNNTGGSNAGAMWLIGFLAGACEIAGLVMMIVGEVGHPTEPAAAHRGRWRLAGGPAGAEIGTSVVASF